MGRRRPGALFNGEPEEVISPAPSESAEAEDSVTEDDRASASHSSNGSHKDDRSSVSHVIGNLVEPPKKAKTPEQIAAIKERRAKERAAKDATGVEETLRDKAREIAGNALKRRLKFFSDVADGRRTPTKLQYDSNALLLEIALDKTPTAQPVVSQRKRILVAAEVGGVPGRYAVPKPVDAPEPITPPTDG